MPTIISNSAFRGSTGPFSVPAHCLKCGDVQAHFGLPFGMTQEVSISGMEVDCPSCGGPAHVHDGVYDFSSQIARIVTSAKISKKDVKRFIRKVENTRELTSIPETTATYNSDLAEIAKLALKQPHPESALKTACKILRELVLLGSATLVGLDAAGYEAKDLFQGKDKPIIEAESSQTQPDRERDDEVKKPSTEWPDLTDL